jgi:hypothetical protein
MGAPQSLPAADVAKPPTPRHVAMSWARRLKRVFGIEIEDCARCGGNLGVIASIEEPQVIAKILAHLERTAPDQYPSELPLGVRDRDNSPVCFEFEGWGACRWSVKQRAGSARADSGQGGGRADSAGARGATAAGRWSPAAAFAGLGLAAAVSGSR